MVRTNIIVVLCALVALVGCGGGDESDMSAACSIERSELGPFSSDTKTGASVSEDQARARMAADDVAEWIQIEADGPWSDTWQLATTELGQSIHLGLTWIDVHGDVTDIYGDGAIHGFEGLRVSRSFQGKLETAHEPLFIAVPEGREINFDARCEVTAVIVGDERNPLLLDVLALQEAEATTSGAADSSS